MKKLVAELSRDKAILQDVASKKLARLALKRRAVAYIVSHYALDTRRACRLVKQTRSVQYYRSVKDPRNDLRVRMREIAHVRVRYGYRRIHVLLSATAGDSARTSCTGSSKRSEKSKRLTSTYLGPISCLKKRGHLCTPSRTENLESRILQSPYTLVPLRSPKWAKR